MLKNCSIQARLVGFVVYWLRRKPLRDKNSRQDLDNVFLIRAKLLKLYLPELLSLFLANGFCVEMEAIADRLLC